ncbi:MAG: RsmB/NOP family class I SAM-dependent RNA methyltransferase [Candidatus Aenigmarchaeota archaeon]|nr:RsmB/NOP family class I SAM-dependent RNA methyltransferase [Candidatus Aenigmarchaeota archaeon]
MDVPKIFLNRLKKITDFAPEERDVSTFRTVRINTIKTSAKDIVKKFENKKIWFKRIPWYENGLVMKYDDASKTIEYYLGYYHIQEAASMIPPIVLNPRSGENVLDMCAAPGSKTTQIAMMMNNEGILVANDDNFKRLKALAFNLQKMGVLDTVITNYDGRKFWRLGLKFDKILLDVPCSNSGKIFFDKGVRNMWSLSRVKELSKLQKKLIESAYRCLKDGGEIVYSTCSVDPEENEEVIQYAIDEFDLKIEKIKIKDLDTEPPVMSWNGRDFSEEMKNAIRLLPKGEIGEGFFVCKLKKL